MIKHFKFWLMVIGALFFVACGSSDSSSSSASSLIEGKTFYYGVNDEGAGYYITDSFNNGTLVEKSFDDTNTEYDSRNLSYTVSGDRITVDGREYILTSISNGIKVTSVSDSSELMYLYNTLADAQNPNATSTSGDTSASSLIEGKTFYYDLNSAGTGFYSTSSFNNGTLVDKSFNNNNEEYESGNLSYTVSGDRITVDGREWIITSISNGIKVTSVSDSSELMYLYNTLADAQNANQ